MEGTVKVFIQKGGERTEVAVEERIQGGMKVFWFEENPIHQQQERLERRDHKTQEHVYDMQVVEPEDIQTQHTMWLEEKVASLEKKMRKK